MSFTIITVALNAAELLPPTIESVLLQDFDDVEYIVVDGTSWDDTAAVLARYRGEIDRIATTFDAGIFHAMNEAAKLASGEYVLFMNAGDRFYADTTLSAIWERRAGDPDIIHGDHLYTAGGRATLHRSGDYAALRESLRAGTIDDRWLARIPAHQATFTRTALLAAGGYDTAYELCADHAFMLRAFDAGARFQYVDETVSLYASGGLSVRRHARCRLEFAALYRRHSHDPEAIDRHFYGDAPPPFPPTSPRNGTALAGVFPRQGPDYGWDTRFSWCAGEGFRLATPPGRRARALRLTGYNDLPGQVLEIAGDGVTVARPDVPQGHFALDVAFSRPLSPGAVVDCLPRHGRVLEEDAGRYVSIALKTFRFETLDEGALPPLAPGAIAFRAADGAAAKLLAHGWAGMEEAHVWSVTERAELAFRADAAAGALVLSVRANPVLPAPQTLTVELNGTVVGKVTLQGRGQREEVTVRPGAAWRAGGDNRLTLAVSAVASPPGDPRTLGLALERLVVTPPAATAPGAPHPAASAPAASDPPASHPAAPDSAASDPAAPGPAASDPAAPDPAASGNPGREAGR